MNPFVADPHWGGWIIWYFFLGGIAAGAYFTSALVELFGRAEDRALARAGYVLAFPLVLVCAILLILDLDQPTRFWHMLLKSEVVHEAFETGWPWSLKGWGLMLSAPLLKYWSPMSIGSWALSLFGACSLISFWSALWPGGRVARIANQRYMGVVLRVVGCGVGFFVASYTGVLLSATNQPIWSDTTWIAPLFLASAASTGVAAMILLAKYWHIAPEDATRRLERADCIAIGIEAAAFIFFAISLGSLIWTLLSTTAGIVLLLGLTILGIAAPLVIHYRPRLAGRHAAVAAAICVLLGAFALRYGIVSTPPELLSRDSATAPVTPSTGLNFGPEAGRARGETGADPGNRAAQLVPRSKVLGEEEE